MKRIATLTGILSLVLAALLGTAALAADAAEEVTIYRDDYGIPHIFADSPEGACFGVGYAQAEDRLEELLKQYRRCTGTMAEVFGPEFLRDDYRQRLWRHAAISKENYHTLDAKTRSIIEAYQAGIRHYMNEHPDEVPAWAPEIEPWMCVALGRYIIWGWPEGDAGGDLQRGGIEPDPIAYRGSNQWLVAPERTAYDAPIALVDPHLGWYGPFRFYEQRLYGGELQCSGMSIVGLPFPALGHNRYCSIAMTTGGPDAADCYEETVNPDNPRQYLYDGQWRDMDVVSEVIRVKDGDQVREHAVQIEYTHHGPVVARREGKAYTLALPYFDEVKLIEQSYDMITAGNLDEMKEAIGQLQLMEQNIMVATVQGDIYYVRNGRVPIRRSGYDYKRPLPGDTAKTEWLGIHPLDDLVQLLNPEAGYMQNCNVSPQFMLKNSPLQPQKWSDRYYLFNGYRTIDDRDDNPLHQRAAMAVELLHADQRVTVDDAISIAMSYDVHGADAWQQLLRDAWAGASRELREARGPATMYELIVGWNRRTEPDSVGAIAYRYWKDEFGDEVRLADRAGFPPPASVDSKQILDCLARAAEKIYAHYGRYEVPFGEVYRVGRRGTGQTWPVGGGSVNSIATPRAIGFDEIEGTHTFLGRGGQTSTQVILMTDPPKSWTVLPLGQSDDPDSPHFDDQAEKLFSKGKMKPTYFLDREELMKHVESKKMLRREAAKPAA